MELTKKILVYDLDGTLCEINKHNESYSDVKPKLDMINQLNLLYNKGYEIHINTARNMLTQNGDEGKVIKNIGKITLDWLEKYNIQYDGITFGKKMANFYIDDRNILNDVDEIQDRINALENNTEDEYLYKRKEMIKKIKTLEKEIEQLKLENIKLKER